MTEIFATANCSIGRNGSNINGEASDLVMNKNNSTLQLIYVDATEGWRSVLTGSTSDFQEGFVTATGGILLVVDLEFTLLQVQELFKLLL